MALPSRLRIVVGGYLGLLPAGGVTWDYVQYPLGLAALGHDVFYIEDTRLWPVYQSGDSAGASCLDNINYLASVMESFGLRDRWAYRDESSNRWFGMAEMRTRDALRHADVFINVSCATPLRDEYFRIPVRALIDSDPMFTQIQLLNAEGFTPGSGGMRDAVLGHTHHFTFGELVGEPGCRIPVSEVAWRPTRQPICLDWWRPSPPPLTQDAAFTTVMNWSANRTLEWGGESWGQKDIEFQRLLDLPSRFRARQLSVAIGQTGGSTFPEDLIRTAGWHLLDPAECAASPEAYQQFIASSLGEFSVAKETYVKARTGWFSCRSACYLASGRPVITQDTGWTDHLPSGEGLLAFRTEAEAVAALENVAADPLRHGRRSREIAEAHFDSRQVLGDLLAHLEN